MKKILILGGEGMLGHKIYQILSEDFETAVTFRNYDDRLKETGIFREGTIHDGIDAFETRKIKDLLESLRPEGVINAVGIIKQREEAKNPQSAIFINAFFPHFLAEICESIEARLIHVSTDCVFSGRKGDYVEDDIPDAEDLYGKTKHLGEVARGNALTLRTSIIGRELFTRHSLVEWFFSQNDKTVKGFTRAIYSGLTTASLGHEMKRILTLHPRPRGLYHLSSEKITKFDLLRLIRDVFALNVEIQPDSDFVCDRSLNSSRYRHDTRFAPPSWKDMIEDMRADPTPYELWRKT